MDYSSSLRNSQDTTLNCAIPQSRRSSQRPAASLPKLDRYSPSPWLSDSSNIYASSSSSSDAACVSSFLPKTRMC